MTVSVIIPAYNYGHYIAAAIQSALAQSLPPDEIIVVDDGSTDDTDRIVAHFDGVVKLVRQKNLGPSAARNAGAALARGDLLAFFDADDTWAPTKLEKQVACIAADTSIGAVNCGMWMIAEDGAVTENTIGFHGDISLQMLLRLGSNALSGSSLLVRRSAFQAAGAFDDRLRIAEDWDLLFRIACTSRIAFIPEPLVLYRMHDGSHYARNASKWAESMLLVYSKAFSHCPPELAALRRECFGRLHMEIAARSFAAGEYGSFITSLFTSLLLRPAGLVRPLRYLSRRLPAVTSRGFAATRLSDRSGQLSGRNPSSCMKSQMPSKDRSPAISVIMPLYNKAQYVERAVESVLAQDCLDYELLIVDDGSTDDGVRRVQSRFNDPRVKIIRQPNTGVGAARNRGLRESRGEICAFLDADDEWYETHLSDLLDLVGRFPEAGILATRFAWTFGDKLVTNQGIRTGEPCLVHDYFARSAPPGEPFINASSCGVRRDVMSAVGGFLEATPYGEDQEYWARISLSCPLAFHPRVSAIYHYGSPGSAMSRHQWSAAEMPVVRTLKRYLASRPNTAASADVLNYAAWIILNQAASGIASGESRTVDTLLADAIVAQSRFQHRQQVLRIAAALPKSIARRVFRIHNTPWLGPWRKIYLKITSQGGAGLRTNNRESTRIGSNSAFHTQ